MRPYLEKPPVEPGSSLSVLNRRLDDEIPFQWHHHPEYELTLTLNSVGQRFIGDHVGDYSDGDLVLIGPHLPHTWSSRARIADGPHIALVMWFHPDWVAKAVSPFPELKAVGSLLQRAGPGMAFSPSTAASVRDQFEALFTARPVARMLGLLDVLDGLARDEGAEALASHAAFAAELGETRDRIDRVLGHLHAKYIQPVSLTELCEVAALSASGLHRMFVRQTGATISDYLMRLRIGEACARLSGTDQPIAFIAEAVGYASLANFNRQFRALRGMTPRDYRRHFTSR
jgi:AraC-like DNA-binding protein